MNIYIVNMPLVHISSLRGEVSVPFIFDLSQLVPSYISPDRITKYKIYTSTRIINQPFNFNTFHIHLGEKHNCSVAQLLVCVHHRHS